MAQSPEDDELARRYYKLGEELYRKGEHGRALVQVKKSSQYSSKPALIIEAGASNVDEETRAWCLWLHSPQEPG